MGEDVLSVYQEFVNAGEFVPDEVVDALAAEVRKLRTERGILCDYLMDRIELRWNDNLLRIVSAHRNAVWASKPE